MPSSRIFIGNLAINIEESDIKERFSSYGTINKIDIKNKLDVEGNPVSRFAYINLEAELWNLNECVRNTNGSKLKGSILKVEIAKENFLDRLRREREQANQPKDINLNKEKNNDISYNSENTYQYNKKEFNFNYSSHNSNNIDNYNKFDNYNSNFKNRYDDYKDFKNNSELTNNRVNNEQRRFGLQDEGNDLNTFSSHKRYYPPTSENIKSVKKLNKDSNTEELKKGFVNVYSKLSFKEESSSFSLLEKFSAVKEEEERYEINKEANAERELLSFSDDKVEENKMKMSIKRKSRNFFVSSDDPKLEDAVHWILTPLTEENQEEFESVRDSLLEVNRLRDSRAKRDSHFKGRAPRGSHLKGRRRMFARKKDIK